MSALSLRLAHSLHERARTLARREGISINQLISTALAEKMAALLTEVYFRERGQRARRAKFLAALVRFQMSSPKSTTSWTGQWRASAVAPPVVTVLLEKNNARVFRIATAGEQRQLAISRAPSSCERTDVY